MEDGYPQINPDLKIEKFENEVLLYSADGNEITALNETAYIVLQLCQKEFTVSEIFEVLCTSYPDQKDEIKADVIETLDIMIEKNIITISHDTND